MKLAEVSVQRPVFAIMMTAALIVLGVGLVRRARPRPDAEDRLAGRQRQGQPARRQRRGDRNHDHQARSRRRSTPSAASTSCAAAPNQGNAQRAPSPSRSSATSNRRPRTSATRWRTIVSQFPRDTRAAADQQDRSRRAPIFDARRLLGPRRRRRSPRSPTSRSSRSSRRCKDVGSVGCNGERQREIQLLLNADRLNAYGLTVDQVRNAVDAPERRDPGRQFIAGPAEVALRTMGRHQERRGLQPDRPRLRANGSVITFGDIGRGAGQRQEIRSADAPRRRARRRRCQIRKQSGTNTVEVVDRVHGARCERIQATLPQDIKISIGNDQSRFIRRSFEDIQLHLILGGLLASVGRVPVHPQPARHLHRRAGDPDLDHRHLHVHEERSASR